MPDRVKESVFNMLGSRYNSVGALPALAVADVFAGSGSMGLEALSRGAASCCFYERNAEAVATLRKNLDALAVGPEATIVTRDAWSQAVGTRDGAPFDLVFLDPPYADSDDASANGLVRRYLRRLAEAGGARTLVVLHHRASVRFVTEDTETFRVVDRRESGSNGVTFLSP
jgi:16S rRNA (guanine966-N2)-methyltransferase